MRALAGIVAICLCVAGARADPDGTYRITGTNPGNGSTYSGTVEVRRTDDTFQVTWRVDGRTIIGIGIGKRDYLAVSYPSGNQVGLAVYTPSDDGWTGIWAPGGSHQLGRETWTRSVP